ncbi:MAG: cysteine desulfurase NifS [Tissierellia bacterium]|nr:cysteine desulfurase NifS [Tissierellia bacterium]
MMNRIYMDNSATTYLKPEVLDVLIDALKNHNSNAASAHSFGQEGKMDLSRSREKVASLIGAEPREVYFTSGGTEADNWAVHIAKKTRKGKHMITTTIEHHAILHTMEEAIKEGYEVTFLPVDENGLVSPEQVEEAIREDTILISIHYGNNEIGTIQPIEEIGAVARKHKVLFHTDAVQAVGNVPIDLSSSNIDMMSFSAHKIYGPKGVGALFIRKNVKPYPFIHGGAQEKGYRGGTDNLPSIIAFAKACELAEEGMEDHIKRLTSLRDRLIKGLLENIPHSKLNGHPTQRLPGNVNISFKFIEGESILLMLDMQGIAASSGSACTSGSLDPSHVLMGIGLSHEIAHGSLRLTLGDTTIEEDVDKVIEKLPPIIQRLREMSPLYEEEMRK